MPQINPEKIADIIREVAAEKIIPRFQQLEEHEITTKTGPQDFVTIADLEAEEELTRIFRDLIPGSYVVGEEAVSKNETDMGVLASNDNLIWVIDPVDGTANFTRGDKKFGCIVALVSKGKTIQSWILDIPADRMAIAELGAGVEINGSCRTFPKMDNDLNETRGFISRRFLPKKLKDDLKDVLDSEFGNIETYLCCAHEYLDILEGDAFFSLYSRIRPWDHLAGCMMMAEAGGYVRKWDRSNYGPGDERGGVIVAQDKDVWETIHGLLLGQYLQSVA